MNRLVPAKLTRNSVATAITTVLSFACLPLCQLASSQELEQRVDVTGHVRELADYLDRVEVYAPLSYRNLALFPLRLTEGPTLRGSWLTMDAALDRGLLTVTEMPNGGRVPVVKVMNQSRDDTIFLMSGEVLSGGKQSRTVRQDVILAPGQGIQLDVFCVEGRRWEGKPELAAGKALLPQSIQLELRHGADQQRIWKEVERTNRALGADNATNSLELAINDEQVQNRLVDVRKKFLPEIPGDTVGFLFVDGGRPVGAEFFGREDIAKAMFPKLLDSYAVDVILQRKMHLDSGDAADREAALAFFDNIRRAGSERTTTPGSGAGMRTRVGELAGDGVSLGNTLVHYGVQAHRRFIPLPKPLLERNEAIQGE